MKIGIITFTFPRHANYGQMLQCYALQCFLKKIQHEPFLIRYISTIHTQSDNRTRNNPFRFIYNFFTYMDLFLFQKRAKKFINNEKLHDRKFGDFMWKYLSMTDHLLDSQSIYTETPIADAYICGSDQIWGGDDTAYYLDFVPEGKTKIAYAPSFGGIKSLSHEKGLLVYKLLHDFSFIGMRESSGVELCKQLGIKDVIQVADPTILLNKTDYDLLRIPTTVHGHYLFLYLIGNKTDLKISSIYKFAKQKGLKVVYVASQLQYDKKDKVYPQIGEWIDYIAKADYVITNSFHGTVFSLIYNKSFITIPLSKQYSRMNNRVEELLSTIKLEYRIQNGLFSKYIDIPIDFTLFDIYQKKYSELAEKIFKHI